MHEEPSPRILVPSLLAGPLVVLFMLVAGWASTIPHSFSVSVWQLPALFVLIAVSAIIGIAPAAILNAIGTYTLIKIGNVLPLVRFPLVWALVGGLVSWSILLLLNAPPESIFPFTAAGTVCALLCRMRLA